MNPFSCCVSGLFSGTVHKFANLSNGTGSETDQDKRSYRNTEAGWDRACTVSPEYSNGCEIANAVIDYLQ